MIDFFSIYFVINGGGNIGIGHQFGGVELGGAVEFEILCVCSNCRVFGKTKGKIIMKNMSREKKDLRVRALFAFTHNLEELLTEKGWEKLSFRKLANALNHSLRRNVFSGETIKNWRTGVSLPNYPSFLKLVEALDCYEDDLLPERYQEILQHYFNHTCA